VNPSASSSFDLGRDFVDALPAEFRNFGQSVRLGETLQTLRGRRCGEGINNSWMAHFREGLQLRLDISMKPGEWTKDPFFPLRTKAQLYRC